MSLTVLDGPMGTELAARGVATPLPGWSAHAIDDAPEIVAAIHAAYAAAGATVHTTNTFRTKRRTLGPSWERLARRAVGLARQGLADALGQGAAPPDPRSPWRVAGSIAPLEDCYRPDSSPGAAARDEHAELARVLADAGVDLLLCETFPEVTEAVVAVEEASRTGTETWAALTPGPEATLLSPEALARGAERCARAGARVVLVSCVAASRALPYVAALSRTGIPFGVYANAGAPSERLGWGAPDLAEAAARYAEHAARWIDVGAAVVGGCCGTGPAHVAAVAQLALSSRTSTRP